MNGNPQRILVRGVNWLGDAVMSTAALLRLREAHPRAHIALLTPEKLSDLWTGHPAIDETIAVGEKDGVFSTARRLRSGNFDTALILPNSPRSSMEAWLAGIPRRIGYVRPWTIRFLTDIIPTRPSHVAMHKRSAQEVRRLIQSPLPHGAIPTTAHQMHEYLHLASILGANPEPLAPCLTVSAEEQRSAAEKFGLQAAVNAGTPVFGLNPGAEYGPAKRWPVERFITAARQIQEQTNCHWLIFGGKGDVELAAQIQSAIGNRQSAIGNLSGQTSLRELCALLKLCRVLLTNDTGPMHIAAAVGTPVVVPFGSTSPELTAPGLPGDARNHFLQAGAPCSPCFLRECPIDFRCMTGISVERIVAAVDAAAKLESR